MHNALFDHNIPTTGGAKGSFKTPSQAAAIILKERVHGYTAGALLSKNMLGGEPFKSKFIAFKNQLAEGLLGLHNQEKPQYVLDIGEKHLNNIMFDGRKATFTIVDGDLVDESFFKSYITRILSSEIQQKDTLEDFLRLSDVLFARVDAGLRVNAKHFGIILENSTFRDAFHFGSASVGGKCELLNGL